MFTYETGKPQQILGNTNKKEFACYLGKNIRQQEETKKQAGFSFFCHNYTFSRRNVEI